MTEPVLDAVQQLVRSGFLSWDEARKVAAERQLAESLRVSPLEIDRAVDIVAERLQDIGKALKAVFLLTEKMEAAWGQFDEARCRDLLQQLADQLKASGFKARTRRG